LITDSFFGCSSGWLLTGGTGGGIRVKGATCARAARGYAWKLWGRGVDTSC